MEEINFNCPHCKQPLEADDDLRGMTIDCPACGGSIVLPDPGQPHETNPPPWAETQNYQPPLIGEATEKQREYIRTLGGKAPRRLNKQEASDLIDELKGNAPASKKQIDFLKKFKLPIPEDLTVSQASTLIEEYLGNKSPTKSQVDFIKMFGVGVPTTTREATELCNKLKAKGPATDQQKAKASELGINLPENTTFLHASALMAEAEMDNDPKDGRPPTKAQLNKIVKLGGDPGKAINRWRADDYICELEDKAEEFATRVEDVITCFFDDPLDRSMMPVKKPSKKIVEEAIKYGDAQDWHEGWDYNDVDGKWVSFAIYAVAPQLLKKNATPPKLPSKGMGCLSMVMAVVGLLGCIILLVQYL